MALSLTLQTIGYVPAPATTRVVHREAHLAFGALWPTGTV
jgi:hypothetical protein